MQKAYIWFGAAVEFEKWIQLLCDKRDNSSVQLRYLPNGWNMYVAIAISVEQSII